MWDEFHFHLEFFFASTYFLFPLLSFFKFILQSLFSLFDFIYFSLLTFFACFFFLFPIFICLFAFYLFPFFLSVFASFYFCNFSFFLGLLFCSFPCSFPCFFLCFIFFFHFFSVAIHFLSFFLCSGIFIRFIDLCSMQSIQIINWYCAYVSPSKTRDNISFSMRWVNHCFCVLIEHH